MALKTTRCCPSLGTEMFTDFSAGEGAKPFLERIGAITAYRNPSPRMQPSESRLHMIPLVPPLPLPGLQEHFVGEPPPDQGKTLDWPHPDLKAEEQG